MARSTIDVAFLSTQKLAFSQNGSDVRIFKVFYGDEPDGVTDNGLSIVSMDVPPELGEEVFKAGATLDPMQLVRITFEVERAGKQKGNNLCLHIEAVDNKSAVRAASAAQTQSAAQGSPAKPDQPKS